PTQNLHVKETVRLLTPRALKELLPASEASNRTVVASRQSVTQILEHRDPRLLVVAGPCSIHDVEGALEYGRKLLKLREELAGQMEIVMRVYFEKPRTIIGWEGLINDPHLDGSYDLEAGVKKARQLLLELTAVGLPRGGELRTRKHPARRKPAWPGRAGRGLDGGPESRQARPATPAAGRRLAQRHRTARRGHSLANRGDAGKLPV